VPRKSSVASLSLSLTFKSSSRLASEKISPTHQLPILKLPTLLAAISVYAMPFTWTSESEKTILVMAMGKQVSFDKASPFCAEVAASLGGGVTPNAVRYYLAVFSSLDNFCSSTLKLLTAYFLFSLHPCFPSSYHRDLGFNFSALHLL
jgi:hypothetical protein